LRKKWRRSEFPTFPHFLPIFFFFFNKTVIALEGRREEEPNTCLRVYDKLRKWRIWRITHKQWVKLGKDDAEGWVSEEKNTGKVGVSFPNFPIFPI